FGLWPQLCWRSCRWRLDGGAGCPLTIRSRGCRFAAPLNSGVRGIMKVSLLMLFWMSLFAGCSYDQSHRDKPETAQGETPIRYVICSSEGGSCFVSARFKDFDSCESHKQWSGMLCDTKPDSGKMECTPGDDSIAVAYCTN